ncbi:hypothetical protein Cob_v002730 [Colletotrichum orbiculare MAFF 240422]|uniref:Uncharacterized protein n=1 Tax=Colletotrichum orbiculare (strain 104-T / ATCC 96160 / CBS 514.97 / LARS 414 / MAFF 240422) TaxID=1213857 RepID=A0A484G0H9_COLOR|nr:hypothetical protein Cob_v002730 [Colletotrichum orbiculare MAFF 240422]
MDIIHSQRRSASHGSLRSSYKSQARRPGHPLPRRLLSVTESSSLLPSPGPLESMLKTTTETGDIGIFTIKPIAPSATVHHCARSRPGLDVASIFRPDSRTASHIEPFMDRTSPCFLMGIGRPLPVTIAQVQIAQCRIWAHQQPEVVTNVTLEWKDTGTGDKTTSRSPRKTKV